MNLQLQGKVIIITDELNGISENFSQLLINEDAIPVVIGREQKAQSNYYQLPTELSLTDSYKTVIDSIIQKFGKIDGLVNNIFIQDDLPVEHFNPEVFIEAIQANTIDCFLLTQHVLPALKKSKGSIINITFNNKKNLSHLIDARTALTREWAVDLLRYDIRVNALAIKQTNFSDDDYEEISNAIAFLLSKCSSHTTGQIICIS